MKITTVACALIATLSISAGLAGAMMKSEPEFETRSVQVVLPAPKPAAVSAVRSTRKGIKNHEIDCIASAIYHEARNQPQAGQIAVAEVVMKRRGSKHYPSDACRVITQPRQFSFVRSGVIPQVPSKHRKNMRRIALGVVDGNLRSSVKGAMFFHATYVSPDWGRPRMGQVGDHVFYR